MTDWFSKDAKLQKKSDSLVENDLRFMISPRPDGRISNASAQCLKQGMAKFFTSLYLMRTRLKLFSKAVSY